MPINPYYSPAECGLTIVGTLDEDDLSYAYNTLVVWRHDASGRLFYAQDSGCSCPTPFEDYHFNSPDDHNVQEVTQTSWLPFQSEVDSFPVTADERKALLDKVLALLT